MRGKEKMRELKNREEGITPAYAGKRSMCRMISGGKWDHPRLCGEKFHNFIFRKPFIGSPPPMRGKVLHFVQSSQRHRITPAYAGKSQAGSLSHKRIEDHPRLCGEKEDSGGVK